MGIGLGQAGRLGIDYAFANGLSIGIALAATVISGTSTTTGFGAIPRIGYRFILSRRVDFIPRLGFAVIGPSADRVSATQIGGVVTAPFVFRVTDSFNLLAAPEGSISSVSAKATGSAGTDATVWSLGAWFGAGGYL